MSEVRISGIGESLTTTGRIGVKRARPPPLQRVDVPHSTEQVDQSPVDAIAVTPDLEPEAAGGRTRGTSALLRLFAESAAAKVPAVIGLLDQFLDSAVSGKVTDSGIAY